MNREILITLTDAEILALNEYVDGAADWLVENNPSAYDALMNILEEALEHVPVSIVGLTVVKGEKK